VGGREAWKESGSHRGSGAEEGRVVQSSRAVTGPTCRWQIFVSWTPGGRRASLDLNLTVEKGMTIKRED
jgi:hypothetical protein